jgi:hypothetical protein
MTNKPTNEKLYNRDAVFEKARASIGVAFYSSF